MSLLLVVFRIWAQLLLYVAEPVGFLFRDLKPAICATCKAYLDFILKNETEISLFLLLGQAAVSSERFFFLES